MTAAVPEVQDPDLDLAALEDYEFEVICDVIGLREAKPGAPFPRCRGDVAEWVAWRPNCGCPPRYRLICSYCKDVYQKWEAHGACVTCAVCDQETGGFVAYTPLKGSA